MLLRARMAHRPQPLTHELLSVDAAILVRVDFSEQALAARHFTRGRMHSTVVFQQYR